MKQIITLTYPDDAHFECVIAPLVRRLKEDLLALGIKWERTVVNEDTFEDTSSSISTLY